MASSTKKITFAESDSHPPSTLDIGHSGDNGYTAFPIVPATFMWLVASSAAVDAPNYTYAVAW